MNQIHNLQAIEELTEEDIEEIYLAAPLLTWAQLKELLTSISDEDILSMPVSLYNASVDEYNDAFAIAKVDEDGVLSRGELVICYG